MEILFSIIIVNLNTKNMLDRCLNSILQSPPLTPYEIIVVDNASDDGSQEMVEIKYPSATLIKNEKNLGLAKANNIGFKISSGKYLSFMNSDTYITENTFDKMLKHLISDPCHGIVGPKILNTDGSIQCIGRSRMSYLSHCLMIAGLYNFEDNFKDTNPDENRYVDAVSGACFVIGRETFMEIHGFDERIFLYNEEDDLSFRVHKINKKICYFADSRVYHQRGESFKTISSHESLAFYYSSTNYFIGKHFSLPLWFFIMLEFKIIFILMLLKTLFDTKNFKCNRSKINKLFAMIIGDRKDGVME